MKAKSAPRKDMTREKLGLVSFDKCGDKRAGEFKKRKKKRMQCRGLGVAGAMTRKGMGPILRLIAKIKDKGVPPWRGEGVERRNTQLGRENSTER